VPTMPEISVDKNGDAFSLEDEVWAAGKFLHVALEYKLPSSQFLCDQNLEGCVAAPNPRHTIATLRCSHPITAMRQAFTPHLQCHGQAVIYPAPLPCLPAGPSHV
jgi:hypothetical protein